MSPRMMCASVCSGIGAPEVAWAGLGWRFVFAAEIEKFPAAVYAQHFPDVPNLGDMTKFKEWPDAAFDVLVGGTPCQSFSVAGLRKGLDDPRGNLALTYLAIAERYRPRWLVWENVPGALSSLSHAAPDICPPPPPMDLECDGAEMETEDEYDSEELHALNCFVAGLSELGYGWAMRVFDAQYFGVPQRRRRVFVVGYLGSWARAAAVLFERESLQGHPAPRREAGKGSSAATAPSLTASGRGVERTGESRGQDPVVAVETVGALCADSHLGAYSGQNAYAGRLIAHSLRGEGFDASEDGTGRGTPLVTAFAQNQRQEVREMEVAGALAGEPGMKQQTYIAFSSKDHGADAGDTSPTLRAMGHDAWITGERADAIPAGGHNPSSHQGIGLIEAAMTVRRLTPRECERLQGFPDDFTRIPWRGKPAEDCPDGPRYKALGNSMAVPVLRWIGERIEFVERAHP